MRLTRLGLIIILDAALIAVLILYFGWIRGPTRPNIQGTYINNAEALPSFTLVDHMGQTLTEKSFRGRWVMVFFGFTQCPKACPLALGELAKMRHLLQKNAPIHALPQVLFISVDPKEDSLPKLKQFIQHFDPHFIAATATPEKIAQLEKQLHLPGSKENPVNHSLDIILVDPEMKVQAYFSYPHHAEQLAEDYGRILDYRH